MGRIEEEVAFHEDDRRWNAKHGVLPLVEPLRAELLEAAWRGDISPIAGQGAFGKFGDLESIGDFDLDGHEVRRNIVHAHVDKQLEGGKGECGRGVYDPRSLLVPAPGGDDPALSAQWLFCVRLPAESPNAH